MKVKPKLKKNHELEPGDLFRLPTNDIILMKIIQLDGYNTVNIISGYPSFSLSNLEVILVEGEFIEK